MNVVQFDILDYLTRASGASVFVSPPDALTPLINALTGVMAEHEPRTWTEYNIPCFDEFDRPTAFRNGCSCGYNFYPCPSVVAIKKALLP